MIKCDDRDATLGSVDSTTTLRIIRLFLATKHIFPHGSWVGLENAGKAKQVVGSPAILLFMK